MPLTDTALRNAKPGPKARRIYDSGGLYVEVAPAGGKWFRFKYNFGGKERRLSLGVYPDVSLAQARERRDEARRLLAEGTDPSTVRKAAKAEQQAQAETFELVARQWHEKFTPKWTPGHAARILTSLAQDAFPWIGHRPIREILPPEILSVARRVEARGAIETAHRLVGNIGMVFRYAVASGLADSDPTRDLRGALSPTNEKHHASITDPKAVADLLRTIESYSGSLVTRCALRLAPLVFVRPGELRHAEWSEINTDAAEWRIPAAKMKMRVQHIVPLSRQALAVQEELRPLTGSGRYVFPSDPSGDYSLAGLVDRCAVERKSLDDLLGCLMGSGRERFERELARAAGLECFAVVVEASMQDMADGRYRSRIKPHAALQSVLAFQVRYGVPFIWCGYRDGAEYATVHFLRHYLREAQERLRAVVKAHGEAAA